MYKVRVADNFHYMDEDESYDAGSFNTIEEAINKCIDIVDQFLTSNYREGMSNKQLFDQYKSFGDDPYIVGDSSFSAWEYAKKRCKEICLNKE
jgi:hypothetical protein